MTCGSVLPAFGYQQTTQVTNYKGIKIPINQRNKFDWTFKTKETISALTAAHQHSIAQPWQGRCCQGSPGSSAGLRTKLLEVISTWDIGWIIGEINIGWSLDHHWSNQLMNHWMMKLIASNIGFKNGIIGIYLNECDFIHSFIPSYS